MIAPIRTRRRLAAVTLAGAVVAVTLSSTRTAEAAPRKVELYRTWQVSGRDTLGAYEGTLTITDGGSRRVQLAASLRYESYDRALADRLRADLARHGPALLLGRVALPYEDFFCGAMPPSHLAFLTEALVPSHRTPDVVCVHGGADPGSPVEEQPEHTLVWGGSGFPDAYDGPDRIVYGHHDDAEIAPDGSTAPRVNRHQTAFGIDGIARGQLMALRFPDLTVLHGAARSRPLRRA